MLSVFYRILAFMLLLLFSPLFAIISLALKIDTKGPIIFKQKRAGKNREAFTIYKFRTMVRGAEKLKKKYVHLNEAGGPVFKIYNDPRYTRVGRVLAHSGLDELPQLINVIRGEMSFVGPRPLPIEEAKRVPRVYEKRFCVLPGITSRWVVEGAHKLSFERWMKLDLEYIQKRSLYEDAKIALKTILLIWRGIIGQIVKIE